MAKRMFETAEVAHQRLLPLAKDFGEFHWRILKGYEEMIARSHGKQTSYGFETTEFGRQVGEDWIRWWVFHGGSNVSTLKGETENALTAAQRLKEASTVLKSAARTPRDYDDLIGVLAEFATHHSQDIRTLVSYVRWLESQAPFGPCILFSYRVWGSTRRGERLLQVRGTSPDADPDHVDDASEIVFGLRSRNRPVVETEYFRILERLAEEADPEESRRPRVRERELVRRVSTASLDFFVEYWESVRDSFRNILLDCESFLAERTLLDSETFWRAFVLRAAGERVIERTTWDFKESLEMWHAKGVAKQDNEVKFCEQVASYANARGGALIIGVSDPFPRRIMGVDDLENRVQSIDQTIRRCSNLGPGDFRILPVSFSTERKTCLIVTVARTPDVIGVHDERGKYTYPIRRQTGLERTDRAEIENEKHRLTENDWSFVAELNRFIGRQTSRNESVLSGGG